ncbi:aminomethyl transferase family protein [Subtercola sp. YIM 133946]|uniref:aminomethyl transferase family protein n=1 Tax=Subtercola sp. YIM 133946 TaxID=3118909 RepID=UPI002F94535C
MADETLQHAIDRAGGPVALLRDLPNAPDTIARVPVAAEYTDWRSEQHAWRDACAFLDQSHHMVDLFVSGPDAVRLLSSVGVNSFVTFAPNTAKQLVVCNPDGQYIGDVIVFHLPDGTLDLVGREIIMDWVQFNAEAGSYDVTIVRDENTRRRKSGPPMFYRYEVQGPLAQEVMARLLGRAPDLRFFQMGQIELAGHTVNVLRHGMAGQPGYELFGPWVDGDEVRDLILSLADEFSIHRVGARAYSTANLESGWVPSPLPAVFDGDDLRAFREWLGTKTIGVDALGSIGGSFFSPNIADYYLTPFDLGYEKIIAFDHEFVGREALERLAEQPKRTKVTLVWHPDDVLAAVGLDFGEGLPARTISMPKARYALYQQDVVLAAGRPVGISMDCGYIANGHALVSLATLDAECSEIGREVTIVWGESPISAKPHIEQHRQVSIRATVAPAPYGAFARGEYRAR